MAEMVTITKERYDKLIKRNKLLTAMEIVGVDNWSGMEYVHEALAEMDEE